MLLPNYPSLLLRPTNPKNSFCIYIREFEKLLVDSLIFAVEQDNVAHDPLSPAPTYRWGFDDVLLKF